MREALSRSMNPKWSDDDGGVHSPGRRYAENRRAAHDYFLFLQRSSLSLELRALGYSAFKWTDLDPDSAGPLICVYAQEIIDNSEEKMPVCLEVPRRPSSEKNALVSIRSRRCLAA